MKKFAILTAMLLAMVTLVQFTSVAAKGDKTSNTPVVVNNGPIVVGGGW